MGCLFFGQFLLLFHFGNICTLHELMSNISFLEDNSKNYIEYNENKNAMLAV